MHSNYFEPKVFNQGKIMQTKTTLIYTQYTYEKRWSLTSDKDALRMIEEEMPQTDAPSTLGYIIAQLKKGKTITFGECRFRGEKVE